MRRARWIIVAAAIGLAAAAKVACGFVGVPLLFAPPVVTTATGLALSTWAAIAAGIGALLYTVGLTDGGGNVFLKVRVNPNAPQDVPAGWSAANPASADPIPPSSSPSQTMYCGQGTPSWCAVNAPVFLATTEMGAAQLICNGTANVVVSNGNHSYSCYYPSGAYGGSTFTVLSGPVCSTGYSSDGAGGCTLTSPSSVPYPADNRCGLKISGGVMSYDSRDPDCASPTPGILSADGKTLQVTSGGNRVQVQINADGTVSVTQWAANSDGTTTINGLKAGNPTSSGSSAIQSSTQSTTTATGQDAFNQTPSAQQSNFPDDYARDATVQAGNRTLTQIDTKLADIKDKLTSDNSKADDPTPRPDSDVQGAFFPNTFDSLRGWTMPARSVACPTWSFSLWNQTYTIDAHCTLIEQQRALMSSICVLVYSIVALFIVLGA